MFYLNKVHSISLNLSTFGFQLFPESIFLLNFLFEIVDYYFTWKRMNLSIFYAPKTFFYLMRAFCCEEGGREPWFSGQGDNAFRSESNDMLQEIFSVRNDGVLVKIKFRRKQGYFYQLAKEDSISSKTKKKFRLSIWENLEFNSRKT